jgi:very-short-patch-repair endonuclease
VTRRLPERIKANARSFRRQPTDAEARLWYNLRRHGLAGFKFRRQHPFGPYILDFYCAEACLAIEVDGSQHLEPEAIMLDAERTRFLGMQGLRVLRFDNLEVLTQTEAVLNSIFAALGTLLPNPLPRGARGMADEK